MAPLEVNSPLRPQLELRTAALETLARGGAVITANARAARWLFHLHTNAMQQQAKLAWPTPSIYHWDAWLSILWKQHLERSADAPLALSPLQERAIWRRIIQNAGANSEAVAALCSRAWKLLSDFNAHDQRWWSWQGGATEDAERFRQWAGDFERECLRKRWISRSDLASSLLASISHGLVPLPPEILLLGFDQTTPAQQSLLASARAAGATVTLFQISESTPYTQVLKADDLGDELAICAWWARRRLEAEPAASLAVIVQNVDEVRGEIDRTFREVLMPESTGIESAAAMPWEFSLGMPLASVPLVRAALTLLRWLAGPLDRADVSWLLTSGFFARVDDHQSEIEHFDAELRERGQLPRQVSLRAFLNYQPRLRSRTVSRTLKRVRALEGRAEASGIYNRARTFAEWMQIAEKLLKKTQWPGARTMESAEYQARTRWESVTSEIAKLGFDGARVSWAEFVTVLDRYAAETIFAPESLGAPIQIMGALEASGQEFDALWFLGADDSRWPSQGQPDPLLPAWLERKAAMPHSSRDDEWALNLAITRRLAASAPECVFSYSSRDETGELRPSPLLSEALTLAHSAEPSSTWRSRLHVPPKAEHRPAVEEIEDLSRIPWPREHSAGGAQILKRQSACAFQSFAMRRLGIEEVREPDRGLSPLDRGNLLHKVLEAFWSKEDDKGRLMRSRSDLLNAGARGELPHILDHHIEEVLKELQLRDSSAWWAHYLSVEHSRTRDMLRQWLDYEAARPDFTVEACEEEKLVNIEGLQLKLRVDRIDRLDQGRLIIDYKSGEVKTSSWDGERPGDPQLPLYAAYGNVEELRGVFFANIRADNIGFVGWADDPGGAAPLHSAGTSKVETRLMSETLAEWSASLSGLARNFLAGDAEVAPKHYPITCEYCRLGGLCRVAESRTSTRMEEVEDGGEGSAGAQADD